MNPNWSQITGIARIVGPAIIGILAQTHVISDSMATNLSVFLASILGSAVWSGFANTNANIVKTASVVQGVKPIEIGPSAAPDLQKIAIDHTVPTVVVAPPAPFVPSNLSQRR
jgi:hypothetical protein